MFISHLTEETHTQYSMQMYVAAKSQKITSRVKGNYTNTSEWKVDTTEEQTLLPNIKFNVSLTFQTAASIDSIFIAHPQGFTIFECTNTMLTNFSII
jgi:hypothetical protein